MKKLAITGGLLTAALGPSLALAGELPAQESLQGLQFNMSPPGARSLGMAGAFVGRADDATAAFANPAGLVNLYSAEISIEGRDNEYDTSYTSGGTFPDMLETSTDSSSASNLSFASFATPVGENWVLAAYRHQFVDFENGFETGQIAVPFTVFDVTDGSLIADLEGQVRPTSNSSSIDIVNYGFSAGWRVAENFSLGFGVSYYDLSMGTSTARFFSEDDTGPAGDLVNTQVSSGSDDDIGFNLGLLWSLTETFSIGLVYRSAPEFDVTHQFATPLAPEINWSRNYTLEAPDVYGVGFSWQPTDSFTLGLDVNRVNYSNLTSAMFSPLMEMPPAEILSALENIGIDDGTEVRLGMEYVFLNMNNPLAVRAGVWNDPDHFIESAQLFDAGDLDFGIDPNLPLDPQIAAIENTLEATVFQSAFQGGSDEIHYTLGLGMSFNRFQVDAAADFSDFQNIYSLSAVFRFE